MLAVIALLTFSFSFGNVWTLGLRLGVPGWIAPLIGPAVDLSVAGLLVGVRYLALHGATPGQLREARLLLVFSGLVCLALNTAGPVSEHAYGRAAFDAVGPLLLLGWAEVGPALLRSIRAVDTLPPAHSQPAATHPTTGAAQAGDDAAVRPTALPANVAGNAAAVDPAEPQQRPAEQIPRGRRTIRVSAELLAEARRIDAEHRAQHDRPVSAATLRDRLRIGGPESNHLVKILRGRAPEPTRPSRAAPRMALVRPG